MRFSEESSPRGVITQYNTYRTELQHGLEVRQQAINNHIWELLSPSRSGTVLDICTGTFGSFHPVTESGFNFVGIDVCSAMLRQHAATGRVIQADAGFLPFRDETWLKCKKECLGINI